MIKLSTGVVRAKIERDDKPVGEISFNPANTYFKELAFTFIAEIEKKQVEWAKREKELESVKTDELRIKAVMKFEREFFDYFNVVYVRLFGEGAGEIIQGDKPLDHLTTITMFDRVLTGWVIPELEKFSKAKEAKYSGKK